LKVKLHDGKTDATESSLRYAVLDTAKGWLGILGSEKGLLAVTLPQPSKEVALEQLGENIKKATPEDGFFSDIVSRLREYISGRRVSFNDAIDTSADTYFQIQV